MKRHLPRIVAAATAFVIASPSAHADVKIGALLAVTGPASFLGAPEKKTLEIYVDQINANGGINGEKIELILYDSGGEPNKAKTFATRLIEHDKVDAAIGDSTTGATLAIMPAFEQAHVPLISLAGAVQIVEPVRKWVFKTPHTDTMACEKIFEDLKKRKLINIALISGTGGFGKSMNYQCHKVAPQYGIKIVHDETYGPDDTDMTRQLSRIKNTKGVQAVVNPGFGHGPAIVTRDYRKLGIAAPLYESHGVCSMEYIKLSGGAANGVRLPCAALLVAGKLAGSDPQKKVVVGYKNTYEKKTGQAVSTFGGHAYDALALLVAAMKRAGSADKAEVRDALEKTRGFIGTAGIVTMSPTDHLGLNLSAFRMLEIKNGDWTLMN